MSAGISKGGVRGWTYTPYLSRANAPNRPEPLIPLDQFLFALSPQIAKSRGWTVHPLHPLKGGRNQ